MGEAGDTEARWYLRLMKPLQRRVVKQLHGTIEVAAVVEGANVTPSIVRLSFNRRYLQLAAGARAVTLRGTFQRRLTWTLEAIGKVEETWVEISFGPQMATFAVRVPRLMRRVR